MRVTMSVRCPIYCDSNSLLCLCSNNRLLSHDVLWVAVRPFVHPAVMMMMMMCNDLMCT